MNKLYSNIEELKNDLKEKGEIVLSDFTEPTGLSEDTWIQCGSTSKGNRILAMNITFGDVFSCTPQYDSMIKYIVIS